MLCAAILCTFTIPNAISDPVRTEARIQENGESAGATATRDAEMAELEALRTRVAELEAQLTEEPEAATPAITPTPPPPAALGQPISLAGDWTVVVESATIRSTINTVTARGMFVGLTVMVTYHGAQPKMFPYTDLVLVDASGRVFAADLVATLSFDAFWSVPIDPWLPERLDAMFDVALDVGERLILESTTDPTFRVEVILSQRG